MIVIEDSVLQGAETGEEQLRMEIGVLLYRTGHISLRKTAKIVGVDWMKLQWFLGERGIYTYTEEMLMNDLKTLAELRHPEQ